MNRTVKRLTALGAGLAAVAVLISGCATQAATETAEAQAVELTTADVRNAFVGIASDYDPYKSPAELGEGAQLVVEGTVEGFHSGRELVVTGTDQPSGSSIVVAIQPATILKTGDDSVKELAVIYVELPNPGVKTPEEYNEAVPAGTPILVYLDSAWDGSEPADEELKDPAQGRPEGEPLFRLHNPQSFIVEANGMLLWPLLGADTEGTLADARPDGNLIGTE